MNKVMMLALGLVAVIARGAVAEMGQTVRASGIARQAAERLLPSTGSAKKMAGLAEKYDYPIAAVRSLRDRALGWGEIGHTLALAKKLGKSPEDIADLREMGLGWWDISVKLAPGPGSARAEAALAMSGQECKGMKKCICVLENSQELVHFSIRR